MGEYPYPWSGTHFFLTFYGILRSRIMKSEMLDATSDETTGDDIDETVYCEKKAWPTNRLGYPWWTYTVELLLSDGVLSNVTKYKE